MLKYSTAFITGSCLLMQASDSTTREHSKRDWSVVLQGGKILFLHKDWVQRCTRFVLWGLLLVSTVQQCHVLGLLWWGWSSFSSTSITTSTTTITSISSFSCCCSSSFMLLLFFFALFILFAFSLFSCFCLSCCFSPFVVAYISVVSWLWVV